MDTEAAKERTGIRTWHDTFVLISCCMAMVLHSGFVDSIGILFTDVMTTFNSTRAETVVIQSTALGVSLCSGILTGALINKTGLMVTGMLGALVVSLSLIVCFFASSMTYLIIAMGVFTGFGYSCVNITSASALSQHVSGRKTLLYLSVQTSMAGIGGMIYPFVIRYLSDLYGLRGSLLITGAIVLNTVPGCILWKQHCNTSKSQEHAAVSNKIDEFQTHFQVQTEDSGENITIAKSKQISTTEVSESLFVSQYPVLLGEMKTKTVTVENSLAQSNNSKGDRTWFEIIKQLLLTKCLMFFAFGIIISIPALNSISIFVTDIYLDSGLTTEDVSLGLFLINMLETLGRLLPGISLQSKRIAPLILLLLNAVVSAVLLFSLTLVKSRPLIFVFSGAVGIVVGMYVSLFRLITLKFVGSKTLPIAIGVFRTLGGICEIVAGPINGYIRDVTGSYMAIFYTSTGINLFAAFLFIVANITRRRERQE
ncbi:monocarboxylate transporter 9-like [Mercenaria mercenaria]|uniref:monocarboxylate transporter 9-like n=1 Tax=Mercenaria mercenaria TaxID=6596 RepID=UPI00234F2BFC|nr:monocarboxylate transporter 9-like [Mercenaria mercenaria]